MRMTRAQLGVSYRARPAEIKVAVERMFGVRIRQTQDYHVVYKWGIPVLWRRRYGFANPYMLLATRLYFLRSAVRCVLLCLIGYACAYGWLYVYSHFLAA